MKNAIHCLYVVGERRRKGKKKKSTSIAPVEQELMEYRCIEIDVQKKKTQLMLGKAIQYIHINI